MRKRSATPPASRKAHNTEQTASASTPAGVASTRPPEASSGEGSRPSSPFAALSLRRTRFSSVPLVELKHADTEEITFPASVELPRRHVTFYSDVDSDSSMSGGGLCSMSDTMESFKDVGGSPSQPSVRIKHLTRNSDGTSRFPKLDECAHFHYDNVELGPISVLLSEGDDRTDVKGPSDGDWWFCVQVTSNGKSWQVRRSLDNFQMLDRQLHRCVYDRKFSLLKEITVQPQEPEDALRTMLTQYLERFSQLAGSLINCGPVLNWLELDNRGNRLIVTDEAAINTPAVAAAYVTKRYASQATDEISLEVGDIISVIDMPPPEESSWWRGKKGFQVGFFPCECVEIIGDKVPQSIKIPKAPSKPVLRKHGKLIAFFRSFLLSRPSRRKLKQSGILKERVFGCDLGEHLMNTGRDIPLVLKCCTEFIEQHGIVDGIYRLSGVTSNIQKLRLAFDEDRVPNLMDEAILQDIHCVASLLKMYFRELPNPLLTFHLYDKFVNAVQADEDLRLLKLRDVVQQLPPPHYRSLEYLMRHLSKVAAHGFQTGMTPKNVAIVWAPNLLRSRDIENGGVGALHVVGVQAVLTEYLIRYTDIIFSEKMPIFPTLTVGEETPKKTRPKSLAISTPTKLLSLEEARSRALTSNLPGEQQKFIDVGGGEENLPIKYHTVIELPTRRRSMGKSKKSPSGWRSFFSRGWHTTSGRRKSRRPRSEGQVERPKIGSPIFSEHSPLVLQDKAVTESDVSHTNTKKLRTVKSAESLFPLNVGSTQKAADQAFSPVDEHPMSLEAYEFTTSADRHSPTSPKRSSYYQTHIRSSSHDSYFERIMEYSAEDELEQDESIQEDVQPKLSQNTFTKCDIESNLDTSIGEKSPSEESTPVRKVAQKQKLVSFDSDASSPKVQKISLKRLYHTLSSPPMMKKKDFSKKTEILNTEKQSLVQNDSLESDDIIRKCHILPRNKSEGSIKVENFMESSQISLQLPKSVKTSVPSIESTTHTSRETSFDDMSSAKDTVSVEVHKTVSDTNAFQTDGDNLRKTGSMSVPEESIESGLHDDSTDLMSFSMEATISDSVGLSQLLSFESKEGDRVLSVCNSENREKQSEYSVYPLDSSLTTPESPTGDNVSEIPSSADSEVSGSTNDLNKQVIICESFLTEVQNKQLSNNGGEEKGSLALNGANQHSNDSITFSALKSQESDDILACQTEKLQIKPEGIVDNALDDKTLDSLSPPAACDAEMMDRLRLDSSFVENIILSPPENFVDDHTSPTATVQKQKDNVANKIRSSAKSPGARSIERSMTEVHEICPKFVSGIAVSGSFGHELFRANNEFAEPFQKKRSCSDKLSPISPIEESRRKFESEIGRLIVRDRQMKLEMEQIKAERQRHKQEKLVMPGSEKSKMREKKFVDAVDFRKSPVKSFECDKKKADADDLLKNFKEGVDERKQAESPSSHGYSCYLRLENKPSVKELLSKFEGHRKEDDGLENSFKHSSEAASSSPKHTSSVFSNVQVINHNFPITSSKTLNFADVNQSPKDNQSSHVKEHIFQTECVVRFPHPKSSTVIKQECTDSYKNGSVTEYSLSDSTGSNSWTSGQSDHHMKVSHSKTAFLSSDNLMSSSVQDSPMSFSHTGKSPHKSSVQSELSRLPRSPHSNWASDSAHHDSDVQDDKTQSEFPERPFTSFKDTYDRANKLTYQMKTEFFQRGLSQEKLHFETPTSPGAQENFASYEGSHSSRLGTENRKRHAPTRQRPKSVPPPICRLSLVTEKQTPTDKISFPRSHIQTIPKENEAPQNVPNTPSVGFNGKESSNTSQTHDPPKRIKDRAAIFERSLSFSGYTDRKPFTSSSHSHKAQSSAR